MKFRTSPMRSKVASRFFFLFVLCSLFPLAILAVLSFSQVTQLLFEQSRSRLRQTTRATSLTLHERLVFLQNEMMLYSRSGASISPGTFQVPAFQESEFLKKRFKGMGLLTESGKEIPVWGTIAPFPALTPPERTHLYSGLPLILTQSSSNPPAKVVMGLAVDPEQPGRGILFGEISPQYLWDIEDQSTVPAMTELCVLDHMNNVLFSSVPLPAAFSSRIEDPLRRSGAGQFDWEKDGQAYLAGFRLVSLQSQFFAPKWTVILSERKSEVLAPVVYFKKIFPFAILSSILLVLLLSIHQIRRNLVPLEKLREGTQRIAGGDFNGRVTLKSGDEFGELAHAFNRMAGQLDKQFHALTTMAEIDRAILSSLNPVHIVNALLRRLPEVFPCDEVGVTMVESAGGSLAQTHYTDRNPNGVIQTKWVHLQPEEIQRLRDNRESLLLSNGEVPSFLLPSAQKKNPIRSWLLLPIFLKERIAAILSLGYAASPLNPEEDLHQARGLANQIAVALSNTELINDLKQLSMGALTALARAIDTTSPWTAGHSERVTQWGLKIGRTLHLSSDELGVLRQGGLLHDMGKIGIPAAILNKAGPLDEQESRILREHVKVGARILEPIPEFSKIIPIVLQHHERFDGTGYPNGLVGEEISLGARILAVADSFDAMASDRPYRRAKDRQNTMEVMKKRAGFDFDPIVVNAFLEVLRQEEGEG